MSASRHWPLLGCNTGPATPVARYQRAVHSWPPPPWHPAPANHPAPTGPNGAPAGRFDKAHAGDQCTVKPASAACLQISQVVASPTVGSPGTAYKTPCGRRPKATISAAIAHNLGKAFQGLVYAVKAMDRHVRRQCRHSRMSGSAQIDLASRLQRLPGAQVTKPGSPGPRPMMVMVVKGGVSVE